VLPQSPFHRDREQLQVISLRILEEVIVGPFLHRPDGVLGRIRTCGKDDRRRADVRKQLESQAVLQLPIENDQIK
jgi:hypothetical protein